MKKKISALLATVLSLACLPLNSNASAFGNPDWYDICKNENVDANAVIVDVHESYYGGIEYYFYINWGNSFTRVSAKQLEPYLENSDALVVGDLLNMKDIWILETYPGQISIQDEAEIEYCGNGIEMLGNDFEKGLLNQVCEEKEFRSSMLEELGYTIVRGDATEDESVDILDVVTVNRTVLGKEILSGYAGCVSDINENGLIDTSDALEIMKYVVGLTDTLGAE